MTGEPEDEDERASDGRESQGTRGMTRAALVEDAAALAAYFEQRLAEQPVVDLRAAAPANSRLAAVLAPLYARDGVPYLLFTRRASTLSTHRGEISFPGGSRDPEDATLQETALREAYEELAIEPALVRVLGPLPPVTATVSNFAVAPYLGWLPEGLPPLLPNPAEVAEVIEAPVAALANPAIFHAEKWSRGSLAHTVYFYDFGPHRIWGLTGRILHTLLALLP